MHRRTLPFWLVGEAGRAAAVDEVIELSDGRRVAYAVYGDPDGIPILNCHGGLLCRFDVEPCADEFRALGVRVVNPDRPGIGRSDRKAGRATGDWADDARELLDAIGIERCAVMGWSLGGQYAAAVAARLGERVTNVAIIAGCPPLDNAETFAQLNKLDRLLARLSTRAAPAARATFAAMGAFARRAPGRFTRFEAKHSPTADAAAICAHDDWLARTMAEGLRNSHGMVDEYRAFVGPWGFRLEEVTVPVQVYQGTADTLVPPAWADVITKMIPHAMLTSYDGEGHMIALIHRADVVRELVTVSDTS
jgi:pimeloyl-ACP methyl ester carboxylesterase